MKLYQLLQKLDKSEKRYFKLYAARTGTKQDKQYLLLFDIMLSIPEDDDTLITELLSSKGGNPVNLIAQKSDLYSLVLEALRLYHAGNNSILNIYQHLEEIAILYEKNLLEQAAIQLKKALKLAHNSQQTALLTELYRWDMLLNGRRWKNEQITTESQLRVHFLLQQEEENTLNFLHISAEKYRKIASYTRNSENIDAFNTLIQHPLLQNEHAHLSFTAQLRYFQIWAMYYFVQRNTVKEYEQNCVLINLLQKEKTYIRENFFVYIGIYSRWLALTRQLNPNLYPKGLEDLRNFPQTLQTNKVAAEARVFFLTTSMEMLRLMGLHEYEILYKNIPALLEGYERYEAHAEADIAIAFYYKCAVVCMILSRPNEALDHLSTVINKYNETARGDIYAYALILRILVHYDIGNWQLLSYLIKSTQLLLKNRKQFNRAEKLLLKALLRSIEQPNNTGRNDILRQLYDNLTEILELPLERQMLNYFDFVAWLKMHIQNKPLLELLKNK